MKRSRIWSPIAILLVVCLAAIPSPGGTATANVVASDSSLARRWTTDFAPLGGGSPAAAYDAESHRLVLFGDTDGFGVEAETWAYDLNTNRWTDMKPARSPPPLQFTQMAYDAGSNRIVLFGGARATGRSPDTAFNDTWKLEVPIRAGPAGLGLSAADAALLLVAAAAAAGAGLLLWRRRRRGRSPSS